MSPIALPKPWSVEAEVAGGGQARVFRVRHPRLSVRALKVPWSADPASLGRLRREAALLASVRHPNVVRVDGWLDLDGVPGLLLEWVEGATLHDRWREGPLDGTVADRVAGELLDGLGALHSAGVVHRDIKASNVLMDGSGTIRWLDLGFARGQDCPIWTASDDVVGSEASAAPEQLRGAAPSPTADVWSVGCLLYRLATGIPPFPDEGDALERFAARCQGRFLDPGIAAPGLAEGRVRALRAALDPDPSRRPADAAELRALWRGVGPRRGRSPRPIEVDPRPARSATDACLWRRWSSSSAVEPAHPLGEQYTDHAGRVDSEAMTRQTGPWVVESPLGAGAGGRVFLARHELLGTRAALKVFHRSGGERWREEGRLLGRVDSPHVVQVLDAVRVSGSPALVMQWVDGQPLLQRVREQGPLELTDLDAFARSAFAGLAAVHAAGIVHRDLSPSNLLIGSDGGEATAWITDFGSAAATRGEVGRAARATGTPGFAAPEQLNDPRRADPRADVFSLGAVLYVAATGRPPFDGPTPWGVVEATLAGRPPRPSALRAGLPTRIERALLAALEPEPERRCPDVRTFGERWGWQDVATAPANEGLQPSGLG